MKSRLTRKLSQIEGFEDPRISLEQYMTPPQLASDILHTAYMRGDIEDKKVLDLGTGTGILAIGSALMGGNVVAVETDKEALNIARENAVKLDLENFIDFREKDVEKIGGCIEDVDTVVMNPPFSVHSDSDILFFRKAVEVADSVYTVSHPGLRSRIKNFVGNSEHRIEALDSYSISLPPTYGFHTEEARETDVDLLITRKED